MEEKRGRGRPPTFSAEDREYLAELIHKHGIRGARRVAKFSVCQKTAMNVAREFGIQLPKGRRRNAA